MHTQCTQSLVPQGLQELPSMDEDRAGLVQCTNVWQSAQLNYWLHYDAFDQFWQLLSRGVCTALQTPLGSCCYAQSNRQAVLQSQRFWGHSCSRIDHTEHKQDTCMVSRNCCCRYRNGHIGKCFLPTGDRKRFFTVEGNQCQWTLFVWVLLCRTLAHLDMKKIPLSTVWRVLLQWSSQSCITKQAASSHLSETFNFPSEY